MHSPLTYRPDIDGLRAIAVLSVVVFHAFPLSLPGGFVGVDIFFVISGFLISGTIMDDMAGRGFSVSAFYARRIRRIFPALILVVAVTAALGCFILYDDELGRLGRHIAASALFYVNFQLLAEAGYFDTLARFKPLLHLWSLAIEEQFYLFWPLLLVLLRKPQAILWGMLAVTMGSFLWNLALVGGAPDSAYFLPVSRFWELAVGGVAASCVRSARFNSLRVPADVCVAVGLVLIGLSLALISDKDPFPGWWGLMPVLGAALLILFGQVSRLGRIVLSNRVMTWFGSISYPLYLWHWPLLSFLVIHFANYPPRKGRYLVVAASIALAWATTQLIERPIRFGRWKRAAKAVTALIAAMALLAVAGWSLNAGIGRDLRPEVIRPDTTWPAIVEEGYRDDPLARSIYGTSFSPGSDFFQRRAWNGAPISVAVIGDSHANRLYQGLVALGDQAPLSVANLGRGGCLPAVAFSAKPYCQPTMVNLLRQVAAQPDITVVVVSGFYRQYLRAITPDHSEDEAVTRLLEELAAVADALPGKHVILSLDVPELPADGLCEHRAFPVWRTQCAKHRVISRAEWERQNRLLADGLNRIAATRPLVSVFDPAPSLCTRTECGDIADGPWLYSIDGNHVTLDGARRVGQSLAAAIRKTVGIDASSAR
jgi:peptidoglycan/LPS O-acetylase OafA/YrhL